MSLTRTQHRLLQRILVITENAREEDLKQGQNPRGKNQSQGLTPGNLTRTRAAGNIGKRKREGRISKRVIMKLHSNQRERKTQKEVILSELMMRIKGVFGWREQSVILIKSKLDTIQIQKLEVISIRSINISTNIRKKVIKMLQQMIVSSWSLL